MAPTIREVALVGDRLSFITHLERLTVVAPALADLARDIDVREEVHLDLHEAVTLARLAPAPLDVERKAARSIAADLRLRQVGEQLADRREQPRVRRRIGPRRAADGTLIEVDHLVDLVESLDPV